MREPIAQYHLHKMYPEKLQFQLYDLHEYRNRNIEKASKPHSHSYYQIIWFFEEGGTHTVDFKVYDIKKDTILFIPKDHIHSFDSSLSLSGWLIHFNESFFMHGDVDVFLKYNIFDSQRSLSHQISQDTAYVASSYISIIRKELEDKTRFGYQEVIRYLLKSLLITLERSERKTPGQKLKLTNNHEIIFVSFKELISQHYTENLSVANYAEKLNVSAKTLTTISKKIVSKTPAQIIEERVILEAKRLLSFTTLQVNEIAYKLGFEDDSYFIKYFKRNIGNSPLSFRNKTVQ